MLSMKYCVQSVSKLHSTLKSFNSIILNFKEIVKMILASAIKFHIVSTNQDVILCGCRHGDIFYQLEPLGFSPLVGYNEIEQGFITNKNKFLSRKEAFDHAKECGQISSKIVYDREHDNAGDTQLFSEDLW